MSKMFFKQEVDNKQKALKMLQEKFIDVKNSLNCKMSFIDYVHVCHTFLVSHNKNISKIKETQNKKYVIHFLKIWVKTWKHVRILIKLFLIFQVIT